MKMTPITITFKNTPDEVKLYEIIAKHSSRSAFVKDVLIAVLVKNQLEKT